MKISSIKLDHIAVLIATGMPGVYRLITLYAVNIFFGLEVVGEVSTLWSSVQAAAMFTAVGWSVLLFSRLPGLDEKKQNDQFFNLLLSGLITCLPFLIVIFYIYENKLTSAFFLIGWTLYIFSRQNLLVIKKYLYLILMDLLILVSTIIIALLIYYGILESVSYEIIIIIPLTIVSFIHILNVYLKSSRSPTITFDFSGFIFGLSNFVSGGLSYLLVPLAALLSGDKVAGIYGLIISMTNIVLLFPRSLANFYMPKLKLTTDRSDAEKKMKSFSSANINILILISLLLIFLWPVINSYYLVVDGFEYFPLFFISVLLVFFGQVNLPYASWFAIREKSKVSLIINLSTMLSFLFLSLLLFIAAKIVNLDKTILFEGVLFILLCVYILRNSCQRKIYKKDLLNIHQKPH